LDLKRIYYVIDFSFFAGGFMKLVYNFLFLVILVPGIVIGGRGPQQISKTDKITFISQPPLTGLAGTPYTYTAKAVSSDSSAKIYYYPYQSLLSFFLPNNLFAVDSVTGLLKFTPQVKGWYTLGVTARSTKGGVATQTFYVTVTGGNGIVQGKVSDTLKSGVKGVIVELFKTESTTTNSYLFGSLFQGFGSYYFYAVTDASGNYRISGVDPGKYKLFAMSPSRYYSSQWYDGKSNPTDATVITVKDTVVSLVNFVLSGGPALQPKVSVSGSIKDTLRVPIKRAEVVFVTAEYALNSNDSAEDFRKYFDVNAGLIDCKLDGRSQQVIHVNVDSTNGSFNASIPPGSYIAFAKADGYVTEFYLEQSNLLNATAIVVQQNKPLSNINFTLAPVPPVLFGSISGSVSDTSRDIGIPSRIIVSKDIWSITAASRNPRSYVVDTDSLGQYSVSKLPPGSYYILALPLGSYAPAYYTTDTASNRWKRATTVVVNGNSLTEIDIYVHRFVVTANGYSSISGTVRTSGSTSKVLPGALIYAIKNNQVAGYSISNNSGAYSIEGLAPGSYSVTVDNLGFTEPSASTASLSYNLFGSPMNATINFSVNTSTSVETVNSGAPKEFELSQNYPNPFNPSTTIHYAIQQPGIVVLKVYNVLGQEIQTLVEKFQAAGKYQVTLEAQSLSSGAYFYRLQSNGSTLMRKMILLR
jgi:hypothetical protein